VGVVERLEALPNATFVRGNTERYVIDGEVHGHGIPWTRQQLGAKRLDWLRTMPVHARAGGTLLVHASPGRDDGPGLHPRLTDDDLRVLTRGCEAQLVLVGHTHRRVDRTVDGVRLVNPGSVGNPTEDDLCAGWAVVEGGDVELRRVAYDRDAVIRQAESCGNPDIAMILDHLRGERIDRSTVRPDFDVHEFEPPLAAKRA
jgi:predicted phosphodiesterase